MPSTSRALTVDGAHALHDCAPQVGGDEWRAAQAAVLDQVEEGIGLTDALTCSRNLVPLEDGRSPDGRDLQAGALHWSGLIAAGGRDHPGIVAAPEKRKPAL